MTAPRIEPRNSSAACPSAAPEGGAAGALPPPWKTIPARRGMPVAPDLTPVQRLAKGLPGVIGQDSYAAPGKAAPPLWPQSPGRTAMDFDELALMHRQMGQTPAPIDKYVVIKWLLISWLVTGIVAALAFRWVPL